LSPKIIATGGKEQPGPSPASLKERTLGRPFEQTRGRTEKVIRKYTDHGQGTPPLFTQGFTVFIKMWGIKPECSVVSAKRLFERLDRGLLRFVKGKKHRWFPSP
jgi:hypothetical protein